jgi:hypothetical protein
MASDYTIIAKMGDIDIIDGCGDIIVTMDRKEFINAMLESYKDEVDMLRQFATDFKRLSIYINDIKCDDIDEFMRKLLATKARVIETDKGSSDEEKLTDIKGKNGKCMSMLMFTILICCQSSFFFPFLFIHQNYTKFEDIEPSNNKDNGKEIRLYISEDNINHRIQLTAYFDIINIKKEEHLYRAKTQTDIEMGSDMVVLIFDIKDDNSGMNLNESIYNSMIKPGGSSSST